MSVITGKVTTNINIVKKTPKSASSPQPEATQKPFSEVLANAASQQVVLGHQVENAGVYKKPTRK